MTLSEKLNYFARSIERVTFLHDELQAEPYDGEWRKTLIEASSEIESQTTAMSGMRSCIAAYQDENKTLTAELNAWKCADSSLTLKTIVETSDFPSAIHHIERLTAEVTKLHVCMSSIQLMGDVPADIRKHIEIILERTVSGRECQHPVHSNPGLVAPCPECGADEDIQND